MLLTLVVALFMASGIGQLFVHCISAGHASGGRIEFVHAQQLPTASLGSEASPQQIQAGDNAHTHGSCTDLPVQFQQRFDLKAPKLLDWGAPVATAPLLVVEICAYGQSCSPHAAHVPPRQDAGTLLRRSVVLLI